MARLSIFTVLPISTISRTHFTKSIRIPVMEPSENRVLCSAMCFAMSCTFRVCL